MEFHSILGEEGVGSLASFAEVYDMFFLLQGAIVFLFSLLCSILLSKYSSIYLPTLLLKGIWLASSLG